MIRPSALLALACGLLVSQPVLAQPKAPDEVYTVRYSYEKWSRVGAKRYVMVPKPATIKKGVFQDRVRSLFKSMVMARRNTYGDARIAFKPDAAKTGVVYLYLDASKKQYDPIVMAEATYTFTENGASKVVFPKKADKGWSRDDVPFPAYVITVPLWQVLPPSKMGGALVKLPGGTMMPAEAAIERIGKSDKALVEEMWSYVTKGPEAQALAAIRAGTILKLKDLEKRLLPVLSSASKAQRGAAIDGLAGRDNSKVNKALRKIMDSDPDTALRDKAAGALSKSKNPAFAAAAQFHALRSKDPKIVVAAAQGLATSRAKEADSQLQATLSHADAGVRASVIASLMQRKQSKALLARLSDTKLKAEIRIEVARALSQVKDLKTAHPALLHLSTEGKGTDASQAATRLGEIDKPATYTALGKALLHPEGATRTAAATSLGKLKSPKGLDLLAKAKADDAESGPSVRKALREIYSAQHLDFVLKHSKGKTGVLKRAAVATLGVKATQKDFKRYRKTVIESLRVLKKDETAMVRAAAARSFETMGGEDVKPDLLELAADAAVEVKRAVAHALRAFPGKDAVKFLLGYAKEDDTLLLSNAVESLGVLKSREALDPVIQHLNHKEAQVRRAATGALAEIGGTLEANKRKPLLSFFSERLFDQDGDVRLKAVKGLRLVRDARTVTAMAALLQDPVIEIRKATLLAMADTGDASAVDAIGSALEDDDPAVRRTAVDAFVVLKSKKAVSLLEKHVAGEKDKSVADATRKAVAALKKLK